MAQTLSALVENGAAVWDREQDGGCYRPARYGDAARDYSPYTIDGEAARKLGLTAPIVHGMCTLALIAREVVDRLCAGDTGRLKRLGCRFSHPLFLEPGQALSVRLWPGNELSAFEAADRAGNLVVSNGFAQVAS